MKQNGLIHIYEGDGKGKTTAAVGLSIRFAGSGGIVLFTQFLKNNLSAELKILEKIEGIHLIRCERKFGFTFQMTPEEKKEAAEYYTKHFHQVLIQVKKLSLETLQNLEKIEQQKIGRKKSENTNSPNILLVLDEILVAYHQELVNRQELIDFLKEKPANVEVVLTGREPMSELLNLADYITYMKKCKHPYDKGVNARRGIEW
ncbi:MAG: cob(I)yrinic acid a,c-diamide adenosyltransferase [Lachnospiraceae bacterium]